METGYDNGQNEIEIVPLFLYAAFVVFAQPLFFFLCSIHGVQTVLVLNPETELGLCHQ